MIVGRYLFQTDGKCPQSCRARIIVDIYTPHRGSNYPQSYERATSGTSETAELSRFCN